MALAYLVDDLISQGVLKTPRVIEAFSRVDRADFVPINQKEYAHINEPLPIGFGQTISQPYTVAFMLELLCPEPGHKILDIGSGSGWQTGLLSYIVSHDKFGKNMDEEKWGSVTGIELLPELSRMAIGNIYKYNFIKKRITTVHCLNASSGYKEGAPYDRIISAASGTRVPDAWRKQLDIGGIIVVPIKESIVKLVKKSATHFEEESYSGFAFVPFIEEN